MSSTDAIREVTAELVHMQLDRELRLGPFTVTERAYAVVTIRTDAGLLGHAYAQTRGAPVVEIVENLLTPHLVGRDSASIQARWIELFRANMGVGRSGILMRALSLTDTALWDIQAQRAGLPLYKLLGGSRTVVPVMRVAGYPSDEGSIDEVVAASQLAADEGHVLIKIARAADPSITRATLARLDDQLPPAVRVVVDASWTWDRPEQALEEIHTWPSVRIAWVEDPFPPEATTAYRDLVVRSPVAVGAGDEVTDPQTHTNLATEARVDVVRLDVSTIGGISAAVKVLHRAEQWARPVSTHISSEVSAHLAAAFPVIANIESFDRAGNRYDPSHALFEGGPLFAGGRVTMTETPGIGWTPAYQD